MSFKRSAVLYTHVTQILTDLIRVFFFQMSTKSKVVNILNNSSHFQYHGYFISYYRHLYMLAVIRQTRACDSFQTHEIMICVLAQT